MESRLDQAAALNPNPGRRPFQRLNRAEIHARGERDLLALDVDVNAFLPPDTISAGFDNVADAQTFSATLMEGYLRAASRISALAVGDPKASAVGVHLQGAAHRLADAARRRRAVRHARRHLGRCTPSRPTATTASACSCTRSRPASCSAARCSGELLEVSIDGERVAVLEINPRMSEAGSERHEHRDAADSRQGRARSASSAAFMQRFDAPCRTTCCAPIDHTPGRHADRHRASASRRCRTCASSRSADRSRSPACRTRRAAGGSSPCRPTSAAEEASCANEIVRKLATQAYRGPLTAADVDGLTSSTRRARKDGDFESGIRMALQAILASPRFLFRLEEAPATSRAGQNYRITDLDLASRLSFFIWGAGPTTSC